MGKSRFAEAVPTSSTNSPPGAKKQLPAHWVIGAIAFVFYCLTLSPWPSISNIGFIARVSGWSWQPELRLPLTCTVLFPFRLLPQPGLPLALNLFTAACAALILTLLARSIVLLQRIGTRKSIWAPTCIAITVCGLQLTFWEHATSFTGEMIDLLIFSYVIRCLFEFRNDPRESWLFRSAVIYGAGLTNNWAMIGYFPLYALAVLLLKNFGFKRLTKPAPLRRRPTSPRWYSTLLAKFGIRQNANQKPAHFKFQPVVFDTPFFLRMALLGLFGLTFYFLLPMVQILSADSSIGFWPALKANLGFQKSTLEVLRSPTFRILAITSLLPVLVLLIGWKSQSPNSGYETRRAIYLNRLASHPLHVFVLATLMWLSFDPSFSPRHLGARVPMLTYYYLSAIMVGYCAAYLLRVATESTSIRLAKFIVFAICTLAIALPFLLFARNFGQIRLTNGGSLHTFAREMYADLPAGKSFVLGTDLAQLTLLRAEIAAQYRAKDALVVELPSLSSAQYHLWMARRYGARWPVVAPTNDVDLTGPIRLLKLISAFMEQEPVYYLHPTFGALFDRPNDSVNGFVHHFAAQPEVQELNSESLWQQRWTNHVQTLAEYTRTESKNSARWLRPLLRPLRLETEPNLTAFFLGTIYSKALNHWGVRAQRSGHWPEAGVWFQRSLDLNPQNVSARINSEFNARSQLGDKSRLNPAVLHTQYGELLTRFNDWREVLSNFGPVDEPTFLFRTGRAFLANGNTRLAANSFNRSAELAPQWPQPKLWLAQSLIEQGNFVEALNVTDRLAKDSPPTAGPGLAQLLQCRASGLQGAGRTNEVPTFIDAFVRENWTHREVLAAAANAYAENGAHEQQLAVAEELLKREPNRAEWVSLKGRAELQLGRFQAAIATLTTALSYAPADESARLSRAIARLGADQLDLAREDYLQLLNSRTASANALFGLGTIAWRKHETNAAVAFYQQYLTNAIPPSSQTRAATDRLREMGTR